MSYLLVYWKRYRKLFFIAIFFLSIEAICDLLQPTIVSYIIDNGVKNQQLDVVLKMSGLMLIVTITGALGAIVRSRIASQVSQRFGADLRYDIFAKTNSYSYSELSKQDAGGLITRITNDTTQLVNFSNGMMRIFIKAPILGIGAFIMVAFLNIRLLLILIIVVPIIIILILASLKFGTPLFTKMQQALDHINRIVREYLSGVRVVKAFNTYKHEVNRFEGVNTSLSDISIKVSRIMGTFTPIITLSVNLSIIFLLWMARPLILEGDMKVGQVIAFMNYMNQILMALTMIFNVYQQFIRANTSAKRIGEILTEDKKEIHGTYKSDNIKGDINYKNLSFNYPNTQGTPVLKDISFSVSFGETIGIIGSTGSGKTTLINLIPGFYHPTKGEITIDNIPVHEYDLLWLREQVSVVAQKTGLFTGTIADNVRWGKMDATREDIIEACKASMAHDFIISLPDGYDTMLGQNGVNLSGGQKQRISIARALVRKPNILILDDCVSAVDLATEAAILQSLNKMNSYTTCFMITQRISSVLHIPKILVLDNGKIAGFGNHKDLLENSLVYQEIYQSQLGGKV